MRDIKSGRDKMETIQTLHQELVVMSAEQLHSDQPKPGICHKHRKILLVLCALSLFTTALGLGIYSHLHKTANPWKTPAPPCLFPACLHVSGYFSVLSDPVFRPCDYFLFACGTSEKSANEGRLRAKGFCKRDADDEHHERRVRTARREINIQRKTSGTLRKIPDRQTALLKAIKAILEAPDEGVSVSLAERKARSFFKSCMYSESPEKVGSQPFFSLLQQMGGWAVSGEWNQTDFNTTLALLMGQYSTFPFFSVYVGPNRKPHSEQRYIQIDEPHFQFPLFWNNRTNKSTANSQILRRFLTLCSQYLALLDVPSTHITPHCGHYLSLSTTLALATSPLSYRLNQNLLYQQITIHKLQTLAPAIDWLACLQATFHPFPITSSDSVLVHNLPYITHMSQTIRHWKIQHEALGTGPLHSFMMFALLHTVIPALDSRFVQTKTNFSIETRNIQEDIPCWWRCVQETERGFDTLLSHVIQRKHAQNEAEELIQNIYSSIQNKLADVSWRDTESAGVVWNKSKMLSPRLSVKVTEVNQTELNQMYAQVVISEEDYFSNFLQLLLLEQRSRRRLLTHSSHHQGLSVTPFIVGDDIIIPVGMFVTPFFHCSYPRAMNYGMVGSLIAKDLLHLLLPDIHTQAKNIENETNCMWSQYQRGTKDEEAFALTPLVQKEVWVQYSALQVALNAYKMTLEKSPVDSSVSGLSYIHLFLSSFTKITCDVDSYRELMPFEASFLVTFLCSEPDVCPQPLTCPDRSYSYYSCKS